MLSGGGKVLSTWDVAADTETTSDPTSCFNEQENIPHPVAQILTGEKEENPSNKFSNFTLKMLVNADNWKYKVFEHIDKLKTFNQCYRPFLVELLVRNSRDWYWK